MEEVERSEVEPEDPKNGLTDEGGALTIAGPKDGTEPPTSEADAGPILAREDVRAILEAVIFASPEPVTERQLAHVLEVVAKEDRDAALQELRVEYERTGRGLQLVDVAGGYQITTRPEYNDWVRELLDPKTPTRLTIQALETLAVIAYKQPVTLPEVIELRGVKSGGVLKTLLEKRLIRIVGRKEVVGRPILYGTTKQFLLHFGLRDLSELPKIEEFAEVLGEEVDVAGLKRAIEAPAPVEVPLDFGPGDGQSDEAGPSGAGDEAMTASSAETGPDPQAGAPSGGVDVDGEKSEG
jgi:segregation and condensation protein B